MGNIQEYVKAEFVPVSTTYHTAGKVYAFERRSQGKDYGDIIADNGIHSYILLNGCAHLDGGNWTLCDEHGNNIKERA